jgi:hypothetical protein
VYVMLNRGPAKMYGVEETSEVINISLFILCVWFI